MEHSTYEKLTNYFVSLLILGMFVAFVGSFSVVFLENHPILKAVIAFGWAIFFLATVLLVTTDYFHTGDMSITAKGVITYAFLVLLCIVSFVLMFCNIYQYSEEAFYIAMAIFLLPFCFIGSFGAGILTIVIVVCIGALIDALLDIFEDLKDNDFEPFKSFFIFASWALFGLHLISWCYIYYDEDPGLLIFVLHPYVLVPAFLVLTVKYGGPLTEKLVRDIIGDGKNEKPFCSLEHALKEDY
jgi:hypothetical protein